MNSCEYLYVVSGASNGTVKKFSSAEMPSSMTAFIPAELWKEVAQESKVRYNNT